MNNKYSEQNLQILKTRLLFSLFRLYIFNILRMFPFIVNYEFILYIYKASFRQSVSHALFADQTALVLFQSNTINTRETRLIYDYVTADQG